MKELNNIVVEVLDLEHGQQVKNEFISKGIDSAEKFNFSGHKKGNFCFRYYGIIDDVFKDYSEEYVKESNAKIITLEQLKAMKEDKSEYPKLMMVWDDVSETKQEREVFCKNEKGYWAFSVLDENISYRWKYAQDIEEEKPEPKKEIINITLPHNVETIIMINGKEVEFKKQDQ